MDIRFSNPNEFERMRRLEGVSTLDDIWDLDMYEEIQGNLENKRPNISEEIDESTLSPESEKCLNKIRAFCVDVSDEFKQEFASLLYEYRNERRAISPKIIDYLIEKDFDLPNFRIIQGTDSQNLLEEYGLDREVDSQNFLVVFQLPKPLAHYWWKGGADSWGDMSKDVEGSAIEWGHFYRRLMPVVWAQQGRYENENDLCFNRVNYVGEHDPQRYYYIWEMSEWN